MQPREFDSESHSAKDIYTTKMRGSEWSETRRKKEKRDKEDRLSALPDEVIHHVFSFLEMREVAKTCLLSNQWRYLWMSTPTLSFDNKDFICEFLWCNCRLEFCECRTCVSKRAKFIRVVNKVLTLGSSNLVKFKFNDSHKVKSAYVYKWIEAALARRVQDFDLNANVTTPLKLPHHLFTSNLRVLILSCDAKVPNSVIAGMWIEHLDLRYVKLPDGNTNKVLDLKFPVLKNLRLEDCNVSHLKTISLSTPVLESMEFISVHDGRKRISCVIKTCTPNLKVLKVYDYDYKILYSMGTLVNYCMEDLSSLVSAEIFIRSGSDAKSVEDCRKFWIKAVSWMYNVQALKLPISSVQILEDSPKLLERLPGIFCNLKHVRLDMDGRNNFHTKELLKFLQRAPNIETLVLQGQDPSWYTPDRFEEEEWISLPSFNHMVTFEIRNFNGLDVEMKFLEFVLAKAIVLKKMIIKTKKEWLQGKPKEKILSFTRASSTLSILFQVTELCVGSFGDWELNHKRLYSI